MNLNKITLHFRSKSIELTSVDGLYRINDLAELYVIATDSNVENIPHWVRDKVNGYTKSLSDIKKEHFQYDTKKGKYGGTYLNEVGVYWFAAKLDDEFEVAVYQSFKAVVNGELVEAVDIANSMVSKAHEHMLMDKPRQRISKLIEEDGRAIDVVTKAYLEAMGYNKQATFEDRLRTSESLKQAINKYYDSLHAREQHLASACERALRYVEKYQKKVISHHKTLEVNSIREAAFEHYCANTDKYSIFGSNK